MLWLHWVLRMSFLTIHYVAKFEPETIYNVEDCQMLEGFFFRFYPALSEIISLTTQLFVPVTTAVVE